MSHGRRILRAALLACALLPALAASAQAYVYWTIGGVGTGGGGTAIGRSNLDGGGVTHALVTGASNPAYLAIDGAHIYWLNGSTGTIGRANLDGSSPNPTWLAPQLGVPRGLTVDGSYIYWSNSSGYIARADLSGKNENDMFIAAGGAYGLAVSQGTIYFTDGQQIEKVAATAGATPAQLGSAVPSGQQVTGITVAGTSVYWAAVDLAHPAPASAIGRMSTSGTSQNDSYINSLYEPFGIAVDGTYIYWVDHAQNTIGRALLGSAQATNLQPAFISEPGGPDAVAVDGGIDPTTTTISCRPTPVATGNPMACTATVTDTASSAVPTGTVNLTGNGAMFFSGNPCTLTPVSGGAGASCVVGAVPTSAGAQTVTAAYSGDAVHAAGTGATTICAGNACTSSPTPTPTPTPTPAPAPAPKPKCVVPKLKGKTLAQARTLLHKAHCTLGKVTKPKARKGHPLGKLVVGTQTPAAGRKLAGGTKVAVRLVAAPKRKR